MKKTPRARGKRYSPEVKMQVVQMLKDGVPTTEIVRRYGISAPSQQTWKLQDAAGIPFAPPLPGPGQLVESLDGAKKAVDLDLRTIKDRNSFRRMERENEALVAWAKRANSIMHYMLGTQLRSEDPEKFRRVEQFITTFLRPKAHHEPLPPSIEFAALYEMYWRWCEADNLHWWDPEWFAAAMHCASPRPVHASYDGLVHGWRLRPPTS